ncbi:MAG: poly(A) polymerase [Pelagibacteraceae bacterium]|nr:poly(A) polymerase [Pelagibacteraceae bacterium]
MKINIKKWTSNKNISFLFKILEKKDEETRFIGGCVRDKICKKKNYDIDLATTIEPVNIVEILSKKKIKIIKSGISHGTVIAIINKEKFEITTLRKDIKTDGRHAKVEFTKDWVSDSERRDFTINAISCDFKGNLYDYHKGLQDLKKGKIKFIGDPKKRIREDFLRILRFFRFYAYYGKNIITKSDLKIFKNQVLNLKKLSSERVYSEFKKILTSENPYKTLNLMKFSGVLNYIIFSSKNLEKIKLINKFDKINYLIDFTTRLAILIDKKFLLRVSNKLKLSKNENNKIKKIFHLEENFNFKDFEKNKIKYIYYYGHEICESLLIYNFIKLHGNYKIDKYSKIISSIKNIKTPRLPIFGKDLIKIGFQAGPKIGKILELVESWWILRKFKPTRKECLKKLKEFD